MQTDVLIIGSGAAGLSAAVKLAQLQPELHITVLAKSKLSNCNTAKAQGGIAAVMYTSHDTVASHVSDTMKTGGPLLNREVVEALAKKSPERITELRTWGARFDVEKNGLLALGLEGGHSAPRIVHHKDQTGKELLRTLYEKANTYPTIQLFENQFVLKLLVADDAQTRVCGAEVADAKTGRTYTIWAKKTVLASGGSGQVYASTTNPKAATGDGLALAAHVGATISNMQYVQFHPTALYQPGENSTFLISEAVRGFGAHLVNKQGNRFLFATDARGELATRDIVSSAIFRELERSGEPCVYLDLRHLDAKKFSQDFPYIGKIVAKYGHDIHADLIPIRPAAHYQCGGIDTDIHGQTTLKNLYALGECANNGLQGMNRLASNSLAEALVFAEYTAKHIIADLNETQLPVQLKKDGHIPTKSSRPISQLRFLLKRTMTRYAVITSAIADTEIALNELNLLEKRIALIKPDSLPLRELQNLSTVARLILTQKLQWQTLQAADADFCCLN
jgi:L-aspartate oxidase